MATILAPAVLTSRKGTYAQTASVEGRPLSPDVLPRGVRSRYVNDVNGINHHMLEAGWEGPRRPLLLLLHGFPELGYSWRRVMPILANAGYHVVAPDTRGNGRTGGWDVKYDDDLRPFRMLNKTRDMIGIVSAFGYKSIDAVIGHDAGAPLAGWCALARPDVFRSAVIMSAPFGGAPALAMNTADAAAAKPAPPAPDTMEADLARLNPPRKYYQRYYATREANENIWHPPQGVHDFLRAYYHMKSADWKGNQPHRLAARTAAEWAKMPRYYVMDLNKGMAEQVAAEMPSAAEIAANRWLPESELRVYAEEFGRTGFQGGLNGYRGGGGDDTQIFAGRTLDVPSMFIGGRADWAVYQNPGALERLEGTIATNYRGTHFVDHAGHWVQQEQPEAVSRLIVDFLRAVKT
jgi:pimeloyl-ACP methyl ester carboxylesterase